MSVSIKNSTGDHLIWLGTEPDLGYIQRNRMFAQKALSIAATAAFLALSVRFFFMIPSVGVVAGLLLLSVAFLLWYFALCHDYLRSPISELLGKVAPIIFFMATVAVVGLGFLKVVPWLPPASDPAAPDPSPPPQYSRDGVLPPPHRP